MRIAVCITILLRLTVTCVVNAEPKKHVDKKAKINETPDSTSITSITQEDGEATVEDEKITDTVLFIPTKEWQEVKSFHKLPAGLHIRINLQTRLKEAKILSEDEDYKSKKSSVALSTIDAADDDHKSEKNYLSNAQTGQEPEKYLREDLVKALKNIKNEVPNEEQSGEETSVLNSKVKTKFRNYDVLKAAFEDLHLNVESEFETLNRLIVEYNESDDENKLNILEDLDFLLHQIDNAVNFVDVGGLKKIIRPGLNSTNDDIRKSVMRLLGSASQSNPKVQIAAFKEGLLSHLLRIIAGEKDASISAKAVFALSCLVRGFPYGQRELIERGGLHALREVFMKQDWHSLTLQLKVVSLIQDLLEERANADAHRLKQLGKLDLIALLVEGEWCSAISSLLAMASFDKRGQREDVMAALGKGIPLRPDHDMVHKVVSTMALLGPSCKQSFFPTLSLLQSLQDTYSELAYKERSQGDDGFKFFQNLASQIRFLLLKISGNEEL